MIGGSSHTEMSEVPILPGNMASMRSDGIAITRLTLAECLHQLSRGGYYIATQPQIIEVPEQQNPVFRPAQDELLEIIQYLIQASNPLYFQPQHKLLNAVARLEVFIISRFYCDVFGLHPNQIQEKLVILSLKAVPRLIAQSLAKLIKSILDFECLSRTAAREHGIGYLLSIKCLNGLR